MATNKKGDLTKEHIYQTSKTLFYKIGYTKATLSKISHEASVPIGLIPYHFTNKDHIVSMIYSDFMRNIDECIEAQMKDEIDNSILFHAVQERIYFQIILNDENNLRFYHEFLNKKSNYRILNFLIGERYRQYLIDFEIEIDETTFTALLHADFGARREFFLYYMKDLNIMDIQDAVSFLHGIVPRLLKIDQKRVDEILEKSFEIYTRIDCKDLCFLI